MPESEEIEEVTMPVIEEIKPKMTDAERLELASKLDQDLDDFIASMFFNN